MKNSTSRVSIFVIFLIFSSTLYSQNNSIFQKRRQRVLESMPENSLLLLSPDEDCYQFGFNFHQNSDLFYLTGESDEGITLILAKPGIPREGGASPAKSLLLYFFRPQKSEKSQYEDSLAATYGYDLVTSASKLRSILAKVKNLDVLFTNLKNRRGEITSGIFAHRLNKFMEQFPGAQIKSSTILTAPLRRIKSRDELENMQKAIDITIKALQEAMRCMKPGLYERQIEAIIEFTFKFNGAEHLAFPTIVGSGPNSLILHYEKGERQIKSGDMVVMDVGCEFNHYCADITRTVPANGKFTPAQKKVYEAVLEANEAVIAALKPGITIAQMDSIVEAVFKKYNFEKYIRHSCSHELGLDVHDVGSREAPLQAGCVVTVEPGLYIPENSDLPEEFWNIGVRIEDDVLITENGHQVLTGAMAKSVEEIEKLMSEEGFIDRSFLKKR